MGQPIFQRSFAGGELAPALHARADTARYVSGLRRCRNFMVQRHGGVTNRAGFRFIKECKTTSPAVQLLRYVSDVDGESVLIEMGSDYFRFFINDALLTVNIADVAAWDVGINYVIGDLVQQGGIIYYALTANVGIAPPSAGNWHAFTGGTFELPSSFGNDLANWYQSGRVITLTHKLHRPYELIYVSATRWILQPVDTAADVPQVTGLGVTPSGAVGTRTLAYVVTAAMADTYEQGPVSAVVFVAGVGVGTPDAPHVLAWTAVPGAVEYYVYEDPYQNGTFAFLGTATGATTFNDVGQAPDYAVTPPQARDLFHTAGEYPHVATDYQQRRWFGRTVNNPDVVVGSRTGFRSNFDISSPLQDDDAITFRLAGNNNNPVQHLVGLKQLIVLTGAGAWPVSGGGDPRAPLTPSSTSADQDTYVGCGTPRPVVVGNAILYVESRGAVLHDLQFDQQVEGLGGKDLTIFAAHLVDGFTIVRLDYQKNPHSIVWAVRSDGTLLGLTYIREQEVMAWHRHDTAADGRFVDVCVVPQTDQDAVYVIVRRTIGGVFKRYIEKLERRQITTFDEDAFFVDSGLSYSGAPVSSVGGLGHLEGQTVAILADGTPLAQKVVAGGAVALGGSYSNVHVGLPIGYAEIETLDLDVQGSSVRDKKKRVNNVTLLLESSSRTFQVGPDSAHLMPYVKPTYEPTADEFTGQAELMLTAAYGDNGRLFVRHVDPLPLTILGIIPNVDIGG